MQAVVPSLATLPGPRPELDTPRLVLSAGSTALAPSVRDFYLRNRSHFKPWDPPAPDASFTLEAQARRVQSGLEAFQAGTGWRWWLLPVPEDGRPAMGPAPVIGTVHVSQVSRGAFHSAMLGYSLDEAHVGRGLMTEALHAVIAEVFAPRVNLHRLQAAYRPENARSAAVLQRLGFEVEGLAHDYLFIDGAWRTHRLTALINPAFIRPEGW